MLSECAHDLWFSKSIYSTQVGLSKFYTVLTTPSLFAEETCADLSAMFHVEFIKLFVSIDCYQNMAVVIVSVHVITVLFVLGMDPFCHLNRDYIHNMLGVLCILGVCLAKSCPFTWNTIPVSIRLIMPVQLMAFKWLLLPALLQYPMIYAKGYLRMILLSFIINSYGYFLWYIKQYISWYIEIYGGFLTHGTLNLKILIHIAKQQEFRFAKSLSIIMIAKQTVCQDLKILNC